MFEQYCQVKTPWILTFHKTEALCGEYPLLSNPILILFKSFDPFYQREIAGENKDANMWLHSWLGKCKELLYCFPSPSHGVCLIFFGSLGTERKIEEEYGKGRKARI